MSANNFDFIAQELLQQRRIMQQLEAENSELRRQLAELREARGIYIEICGKRYPVVATPLSYSAQNSNSLSPSPVTPLSPTVSENGEPSHSPTVPLQDSVQQNNISSTPSVTPIVRTSQPRNRTLDNEPSFMVDTPTMELFYTPVPEVAEISPIEEDKEDEKIPQTFLEEIMIDEFAAASTNPLAIWSGPTPAPKKKEETEEERKAALRRELMGSFLLE